ncbi:hypothetical protein OPS25_09735 [Alteromonas ponticola]|uniref:OmpH family outer membrane protein n=1 Tax=Alteromonas aquimaris TaxID=2998417 RepID=A0ABT3P7N4_9ALTE|nr:hypothetical protein [Alteromonas aquimaris]MCW8108774.1 hypothetical protein [Alteromonas aquimaris]
MIKLTKVAIIASGMVAFTTHLSLANPSEYRLIAFDNCEVVTEHELNASQIEAYRALKSSENRMESISQPIHLIQDDIDSYSEQIGELTERAVKEEGDMLFINKALLNEQKALTEKLETLIKAHEADFSALEKEGRRIEVRAREFEKQVHPLLENISYDFIRIIGPENKDDPYSCNSKNIAMFNL